MRKIWKTQKRLVTRIAALSVILLLFFVLTSSKTWAFEIDTTGFSTPSRDSMVIYYWHKGLPPRTKGTQTTGPGYPVLIVWNQYFWHMDSQFEASFKTSGSWDNLPKYSKYGKDGEASGIKYMNMYYPLLDHGRYPDGYPHGWYNYSSTFKLGAEALLSNAPVDFDLLQKNGTAVSFDTPIDIPVLYSVSSTSAVPSYAIALQWSKGTRSDYFKPNQSNFIGARFEFYSYIKKYDIVVGTIDGEEKNYARWVIDYLTISGDKGYVPFNTYADSSFRDSHYVWQFNKRGERYTIFSPGTAITSVPKIHVFDDWSVNPYEGEFRDYKSVEAMRDRKTADIVWMSGSSALMTQGNTTADKGSLFDIYYAEPQIVDFLNSDFEVQNGQVSTLDGPIVIPQDTTITVKDGGVLSMTGWIINNGTIKVEGGGTLIVQDGAAITTSEKKAGMTNGRIACDGVMIVSPGAKVQCGGIDGLKFGEGAQCVNYGALIAENFTVYTDHTIENRGIDSYVFAGYGITDVGFTTWNTGINQPTFATRGTREKSRSVSIPNLGVYGEGAARVVINPDASYKSPANRKGSACDSLGPHS